MKQSKEICHVFVCIALRFRLGWYKFQHICNHNHSVMSAPISILLSLSPVFQFIFESLSTYSFIDELDREQNNIIKSHDIKLNEKFFTGIQRSKETLKKGCKKSTCKLLFFVPVPGETERDEMRAMSSVVGWD